MNYHLARALFKQGNLVRARTLLEESLPLYREMGQKWGRAYVFVFLGQIVFQQGDVSTARAMLDESLRLHQPAATQHGPHP